MNQQATPVIARQFRLRWRFDFADGRIKRGVWNGASPRAEDGAWAVNKTGLLKALVEGEDIASSELHVLAEAPGPDYVSASWEAYSRMPGGGLPPGMNAVKLRPVIAGLTLILRDEAVSVYVDGRVERRLLRAEEKNLTLREHTAGS